MTKIILFNGPPRSGKDTLAAMLQGELSASKAMLFTSVEKFAAPLKRTACSIYCNGNTQEWYKYDSAELKDTPSDNFFGKTPREVQIAISEQYMKPVHGEAVFGKMLVKNIKRALVTAEGTKPPYDGFLISDSGFRQEAEELIKEFGAENVILVRLVREGFTYEGDSRDYINLDDLGVVTYDITNVEGQPHVALAELLKFAPQFIQGE